VLDPRRRTLVYLLDILGLDLQADSPNGAKPIDPYVDLLLDVRKQLRDMKHWALADEIRNRLAELGVTVEDKPGGVATWRMSP
jgi:cysteinyl-tRNA synthetase